MKISKSKFRQVKNICDEINTLTNRLNNNEFIFIEEISIEVKFNNSELCFHNLISWFYILYFENSGKNIDFLKKKINAYQINLQDEVLQVKSLVHAFRTIFQHQMDFINSKLDKEKKNLCNFWFHELIQKNAPSNSTEWEICVLKLLDLNEEMLKTILICLKEIEKSEHQELVIDEWKKIIMRNYSVYDFELVLLKVLTNLGLEGFFDTNALVKKNINSWRADLEILPNNFNFEEHAYKVIERFILKKEVLPIDGNDIIALGIDKGKVVFELLLKARQIFYNHPCNKENLLIILQKQIKLNT